MIRTMGWRLVQAIPTLLIATLVVFGLLHIVPGDPARQLAGEGATDERIEEVRQDLGLDRPLVMQYGDWLGDVVRLDLGTSIRGSRPVLETVLDRFQVTGQIVLVAIIIAGLLGVALGIFAATKREKASGKIVRTGASLGVAIPNFWLGMVLIVVFSLTLRWFPATGWVGFVTDPFESLRHTLLPAAAVSAVGVAEVARQTASALTTSLSSDATRTHLAKGLSGKKVLRHALKNAGVPILTVLALLVNRFLGATVVIETVFSVPGAGRLVVESISWRDFPMVQGVVMVMVVIVLVVNFFADVGYRTVDPRIE